MSQQASVARGDAAADPARLGVPNCKIELPSPDGDNAQFGGTRTITQSYTFSVAAQIGEGTYGQVFKGEDKQTGDKVALKKIRMDTEKEGFPITAIREIKILSMLNDDNVVNLREIVRSDINRSNNFKGSIYMVFDYAEFDLTGLMESQHYKFTEAQVKCIMKQLLKGLAYCHLNGVLHRDLKASNILIDARGIVKLADFGLARPYKDGGEGKFTNRVITLWYRPPELLLGAEKYGPEIDMWSVGCIFAELLCGKPIFPGKDEPDQLDKIFSMLGTPTEKDWPGVNKLEGFRNVPKGKYQQHRLKEWCTSSFGKQGHPQGAAMNGALALLDKLLQEDPAKRISATNAYFDSWLWVDPLPVDPQDLPISSGSQHEFTMKKRRNDDRARADQDKAAAAAAASCGGGSQDKRQRQAAPPTASSAAPGRGAGSYAHNMQQQPQQYRPTGPPMPPQPQSQGRGGTGRGGMAPGGAHAAAGAPGMQRGNMPPAAGSRGAGAAPGYQSNPSAMLPPQQSFVTGYGAPVAASAAGYPGAGYGGQPQLHGSMAPPAAFAMPTAGGFAGARPQGPVAYAGAQQQQQQLPQQQQQQQRQQQQQQPGRGPGGPPQMSWPAARQ